MPALLNSSPSPGTTLVKPVGLSQAFAAMVRPSVLFTDHAEDRAHMVQVCLYAWNIGAMPAAAERDEATTRLGLALARRCSAKQRLASSETDLLRTLVTLRRETFPFLTRPLSEVQFVPGQGKDTLTIFSSSGKFTAELMWQPSLDALIGGQEDLQSVVRQVAALQADLETWASGRATLADVWATRACNQCRLLLLELSTQRSAIVGLSALHPEILDHQVLDMQTALLARIERWVLTVLDALGSVA